MTPRHGWAVSVGRHRRQVQMRVERYAPTYGVARAPGSDRWEPSPAAWILISFILGAVAGFALAAGTLP